MGIKRIKPPSCFYSVFNFICNYNSTKYSIVSREIVDSTQCIPSRKGMCYSAFNKRNVMFEKYLNPNRIIIKPYLKQDA